MDRFPEDFMFELSKQEQEALRSHFGTLKRGGHSKYLSYAFTEQGVAMLSSVLRSKRAVRVNVEIMRAFVRLREVLATHKDLARKLEALEKKYDSQFRVVFDAIRQLMTPPEPRKRKIGFLVRERAARYGRSYKWPALRHERLSRLSCLTPAPRHPNWRTGCAVQIERWFTFDWRLQDGEIHTSTGQTFSRLSDPAQRLRRDGGGSRVRTRVASGFDLYGT